jgi:small-conductance mechanosensitive channel
MALDLSPVSQFVGALTDQATVGEWIAQLAVLAAGLAAAWFVARWLCSHVRVAERWKFGKGDFRRVAFPVMALLFLWVGKVVLDRYQDVAFLGIVVSLAAAFAIIRSAGYILGHIIPEGGFQHVVIRLIAWVAWIAVVLHVTGLLPEVLEALNSVGFKFGKDKHEVTALDVMKGVLAMFLTITLALWISRITESRVLASQDIELTTRVVITKAVRVGALFLAIFIALPMAGIDVTTLSIFSGALGVGLGFGLQKIASNYVSGFIVLLDRSLRIGDVVTVDNRRGEVKAIEARYTVIKGGDGVESIIPNEKLITESVNHHTYSDPKVSMVIGVWISYESDVDTACALLLEAGKRQARVIDDPAAAARVKQLGDHGIELELTIWIGDPHTGEGDLRSDLLKDILRSFRASGVEIPYPRRDVRLFNTVAIQKGLDVSGA